LGETSVYTPQIIAGRASSTIFVWLKPLLNLGQGPISQQHCFIAASTPRVVHSTEAVEEYMDEMAGWSTRNGIEVKKTREKVYTKRDEQGATKREWMCFG